MGETVLGLSQEELPLSPKLRGYVHRPPSERIMFSFDDDGDDDDEKTLGEVISLDMTNIQGVFFLTGTPPPKVQSTKKLI